MGPRCNLRRGAAELEIHRCSAGGSGFDRAEQVAKVHVRTRLVVKHVVVVIPIYQPVLPLAPHVPPPDCDESVWDHDATYGAALQNLKYTDARQSGPVLTAPSRWQKSMYGFVTVGGRYMWAKWEDWLVDRNNHDDVFDDEPGPNSARVQRLARITSTLSTAHAAAGFVSFLAFLLHGRYRTLLDRILRMRLAPPTSQVSREVSFEYLNRQLVWHAFTEFLLFVLPLVKRQTLPSFQYPSAPRCRRSQSASFSSISSTTTFSTG